MRRAAAALLLVAAACTSSPERPSPSPTLPVAASCPARLSWRTGPEMAVARTEVAAASLFDRVYVAGGFTADGKASKVVEVYDPKRDRWSRIPDLPEPRHHAGLAAADGNLWLIGGYDADGAASDEVWRWAVGDREWREGPRLPAPRGAMAVAVVGEGIHVIGGATSFGGSSRLSDDHAVLVRGTKRWQLRDPVPVARDHVAAAAITMQSSAGRTGGEIYVVGGRHLSLETNEARVDRFLVEDAERGTGHWEDGFAMPRARGGLAAVVHDVELFVFGGEEPQGTIAPVDYYEIEDGAWCGAPPMPTSRHGLGAAVAEGRIHVVGGGPEPGLSVSGRNEILSFD